MSLMAVPVKMMSFEHRTPRRVAPQGKLAFVLRFHRRSGAAAAASGCRQSPGWPDDAMRLPPRDMQKARRHEFFRGETSQTWRGRLPGRCVDPNALRAAHIDHFRLDRSRLAVALH